MNIKKRTLSTVVFSSKTENLLAKSEDKGFYLYTWKECTHVLYSQHWAKKNEQNKQTVKCTLGNFYASYQSRTDHCRGRMLNNQIIE